MPRIRNLTTRAFRGIVDEALPFDGRSLVLLGENGTGKSSFVDALEFFFTGKVSHLEGSQGVSTTEHAPHIRASSQDALVEVEFDQPSCTPKRTLAALVGVPAELRPYVIQASESKFILRRKQLLDFILAQPAPRYAQLAAIIGVDDLDKCERLLMQARDELESARDVAARRGQDAAATLKHVLGDVATTDEAILTLLNQRLQEIGQTPLETLGDIETRKVAAVALSHDAEDAKRLAAVTNLLSLVTAIDQAPLVPPSYADYATKVKALRADAEQRRQMLFASLLESSRGLVADLRLDYCPVCLRPIDNAELLASLDARIRATEAVSKKATVIRRQGVQLAQSLELTIETLGKLSRGAASLELATDCTALSAVSDLLKSLGSSLTADPWEVTLVAVADGAFGPASTQLGDCIALLREELGREKLRLTQTDQDKLAVDVITLLSKTEEARGALRAARVEWARQAATHREMSAIYDCFVTTKQREVQAIYSELEGDIQSFFQRLHKDEGYQIVRLEIDEGRRASTRIRMNYHDREDEDPRGFNSEGHLDSLGLCIFLAFVKHFNLGFPLMVLDDVVSSIDSRHRRHICDLLLEEFADYQLFVTTHDYEWFEEICAHQRAAKAGHLFTNLQIVDWTLEGGPHLNKYRSRWERIEDKLASGDRDGAAGDIRKELEGFLYEMCINTKTSVVLKHDRRYVVTELMDPFVKHFGQLVPSVRSANGAVFQSLAEDGIFGNMLVHHNPSYGNVSLDEVRAFADAVLQFENLFTCEQGHRVEYFREAKIIKCRCGAISWLTKD